MHVLPALSATLLAVVVSTTGALAAETRLGLAAPLSGDFATLGEQMRSGAALAAENGRDAALEIADDQCSADGGRAAAQQFVEAEVSVAVGFLCIDSIEAALPVLKDAGIPVVTTGVRVDSLTERRNKTGWPVFRLAPRAAEQLQAAQTYLIRRWSDEHIAIIDDGTIYGRELAEGFRLAAEQAGLNPVFTDTFRPQLDNQIALAGRLRKAGATHVLAGGDRSDIAILGRDAAELDYGLTIAGGETLRAADNDVALAPGTLMIGLPEWADLADPQAVEVMRKSGVVPEGYILPTYAAVETALQAVRSATSPEMTVATALQDGAFATVLGEVRFDDMGDWQGNPYRLFEFDGETFRQVTE
ncbi:branched-chain amino acid ABC transporter substrate-binding protein [Mesorhizobium xinjiangense]|uniref:branched-chain amino acid ABC transporter substrate-binding protein n=1 Tax=Mesorhizobium xinjiangense TaxID=2678685 RepID=UPI0012EE0BD5|nr:branched-chain amino acid ABC transporter substrate-binding protein [Mesorhizobium xinjiangense]